MKRTAICCVVFFGCCLAVQSQLQLNTGQSWSYSFNSLPLTGFVSVFTATPNGELQLTIEPGSFQPGSRLLYEMHEDAPTGTPVASGTMDAGLPATVSCQSLGAWQDLQGSIKLTMQSGSAVVDSVTLQAIVSGASLSAYEVHSDVVVVPEPGTWALVAVGMGLVLWRSVSSKRLTPRPRALHEPRRNVQCPNDAMSN